MENTGKAGDGQVMPGEADKVRPPGENPDPLTERPCSAAGIDASGEGQAPQETLIRRLEEQLEIAREQLRFANEELEASREKLRALDEEAVEINTELQGKVESIALFPEENPSPVLRVSGEGTLRYANRAAAELLVQWRCSIGDAVPEFVRRELAAALNKSVNRELEVRCGERFFSFILVPIAEGGYVNFYGRDVTERQHAEEALHHSRKDLDRAQAVGQIGSWRLDVRRNILTWSDENHRIFGVPKGTPLTYERFLDIVHPDDRQYVDGEWKAGLRGEPYDIEHRIVVGRGVKWVREKAYLEFDDGGNLLGGFGTTQDITERKQAEERIQRQKKILEGINRIFHEALTAGSVEVLGEACLAVALDITQSRFGFIGETGPDGKFHDNAISETGWELCSMYDKTGHRRAPGSFNLHGLYGRVLADGKGFFTNDAASHPDSIGTPVGHPPLASFLGVPLLEEGRTIGMIAVGNRDGGYGMEEQRALEVLAPAIVEALLRKRAEDALRKAHDELEQRVRERTAELREKDQLLLQQNRQAAMGEMIGNIAHQWRQPLNGLGLIIQSLPLMHASGKLDRDKLETLGDRAMQIIRHMSQTIDDFRNYFKPDKEKVWFRVNEPVTQTIKLIEEGFKNQQIVIELDVAGDPVINGYPNEFAQVLLNILINARDAICEREVRSPKISICVRTENGKAVVTIADNAGGIPGNILDRVFEPYFTTKRHDQGTGIGLFMSKTIIEKSMGGRLVARNTAEGAEFRIEV